MCPRASLAIILPTLRALLDYQAEQACARDPADLAEIAILEWLQRERVALHR